MEIEERTNNLERWSAKLRKEQDEVIERMKERKKRQAQLGDRKSAAAQNRMKSIAALAADNNGGRKRKKGDEGTLALVARADRQRRMTASDETTATGMRTARS